MTYILTYVWLALWSNLSHNCSGVNAIWMNTEKVTWLVTWHSPGVSALGDEIHLLCCQQLQWFAPCLFCFLLLNMLWKYICTSSRLSVINIILCKYYIIEKNRQVLLMICGALWNPFDISPDFNPIQSWKGVSNQMNFQKCNNSVTIIVIFTSNKVVHNGAWQYKWKYTVEGKGQVVSSLHESQKS